MTLDYSELDSFVILIGLKGSGEITDNEGNTTTLCEGETILIPATTSEVKVTGNIKFLETYVQVKPYEPNNTKPLLNLF